MNRRLTVAIRITLACGIMAGAGLAQKKSDSEVSFLKARQVLEDAIKASGGLDELKAINDISRVMEGVRTDEGQGLRPVAHRSDYFQNGSPQVTNRPKVVSVRDLRKSRLSESLEDTIVGGQPIVFRTVMTQDSFFTTYDDLKAFRVIPSSAIGPSRVGMYRRYPETLLPAVRNRPESLRWGGESQYEGRKQNVITFADSDGVQLMLFFDAETKLLTKVESLVDSPVLGDIANESVYADYRPVNKLTLPFRYIEKSGGVMLQDMRASSISVNTNPPDSLFVVPEGLSKYERMSGPPTVTKLGEDVYAVLGAYNSVFVVFNDYVLVIEAGHSSGYASDVIAKVKQTAPGKPIRYLVSTHFHYDHLSGVRSYVNEGASIITTPTAKDVIENLIVRSPHVMRPDSLARNGRAPMVETFSKKRVFEDGAHKVELYDISPNPHCAEMIVAYLPNEKILFEADMLDIEIPGHVGTGGEDTADLADKIQRLGLGVDKIVPAHGRIGTLDDLKQAVERRRARKQN
ncbi:MAG TPA: MBL fold metallo-hydrolase [Blastocatellia bacterium]|nr:MBL fold metallo-hydrolase [Blastocatellia bacterium]